MRHQIPQEMLIKSQYAERNEHIIKLVNLNCVDCAFVLSLLYSLGLIKRFTLNNEASIFIRMEYFSSAPDAKENPVCHEGSMSSLASVRAKLDSKRALTE